MNMTLRVAPEEMTQAITQFNSTKEEATAAVAMIEKIIGEISSAWSGDDAELFKAKMETMSAAMKTMEGKLDKYVTDLSGALNDYQTKEGEIASQISALEDVALS